MQGKLVFNQSRSTFLSMKRCCMHGLPRWGIELDGKKSQVFGLFTEREISRSLPCNLHWIGFGLGALMPRGYGVSTVGHVVDFEGARLVGRGKIGSWRNHDVGGHFGMDIAQQRHD